MKKTLSLFLALVMALSLCVTAFAGNATGSTVLCLTGDAADQVVDLKSGQRLSADSSTLVRLNVLDDPGAEEYTVTLDGKKLDTTYLSPTLLALEEDVDPEVSDRLKVSQIEKYDEILSTTE